MANNDVWDAIAQQSGTPAQSFEFLLDLYIGVGGVTPTRFADATNVNPAFTAKNRVRQTYAAKGADKALKYADNLVLTFDVEAVRDANGLYQATLQDLLNASKANGVNNIRRMRAYDALGADYAMDADFSISATRTNTDWDSAAFYTITATQYVFRGWITNPVLTVNVPIIDLVTPNQAATAATVYIEGEKFTGVAGATGVKFAATNATSYVVVNDGLITAVVPAVTLGSAPITVTNPAGVSNSYPWTKI
jgi:hypothetical protein